MAEKQKIVFMGTPDFAADILRKILAWPAGEVVAVYCQPDKPAGRGLKTTYSPVKILAIENNIPVLQPESLRNAKEQGLLAAYKPDFIIVAAYGLLLPQEVLDIALPVNVHASILPSYRGAAPIQRAIMESSGPDAVTGVSIMRITQSMDAGPVYASVTIPVGQLNAAELTKELAELGGDLLVRTLDKIIAGEIQAIPQDESRVTYAPKLHKNEGKISWTGTASQIDALIRGLTPWPGAQAQLEIGDKLYPVTIISGEISSEPAQEQSGVLKIHKNRLSIACSDYWYDLKKIKPQGRREMSASDFINGQCKGKTGLIGRVVKAK